MSQDLQALIDATIGDYATVPDHPQEPPLLAVERQKIFEKDLSKLARLRAARLKAQRGNKSA